MDLFSELAARRAEAEPAYLDQIVRAARHLVRAGVPERSRRVGEPAPDFVLSTPEGRPLDLKTLLRSGPVVLSFVRGEWCPFCRAEIEALLHAAPAMLRLGASVVVVSAETPSAELAAAAARFGPRVAAVQDRALGVALLYGLVYLVPDAMRRFYLDRDLDLSRHLSTGSWMLPIPADYVVARDGSIALAYVEPDFTRRLDPSIMVETLARMDRSAATVAARQVRPST